MYTLIDKHGCSYIFSLLLPLHVHQLLEIPSHAVMILSFCHYDIPICVFNLLLVVALRFTKLCDQFSVFYIVYDIFDHTYIYLFNVPLSICF